MNLGIIQGRLSMPVRIHIQEFPRNWKKEFELLDRCGLSHIEWLVTKGTAKSNPAFDEATSLKEFPISSYCADTLVDIGVTDDKYLKEHLQQVEYHRTMATKAQGALEVLLQLHPEENEEN